MLFIPWWAIWLAALALCIVAEQLSLRIPRRPVSLEGPLLLGYSSISDSDGERLDKALWGCPRCGYELPTTCPGNECVCECSVCGWCN